jgi:RNA polymerase sigma-70 factor (ECF subfamily)
VRYLIFLTGRRDLVEDWTQETWVRVLNRAKQYDGRWRFEAWLFSIARNLAIDDLRRQQNVSLDATGVEPFDPVSPFLTAARNEEASRLAIALGALEPIYREALVLRLQGNLSLQEISHLVGAACADCSVTDPSRHGTIAATLGRGCE